MEGWTWWVWHHSPARKIYWLSDHLGGFNSNFRNVILDQIPDGYTVYTEYILPKEVHAAYPALDLRFSAALYAWGNNSWTMSNLAQSSVPSALELDNFISCFNRSNQAGRHAVLAELHRRGWYNSSYCTKHFELDLNQVYHNGIDITDISQEFVTQLDTKDFACPCDHEHNLVTLSPMIRSCFLHLVTETMSQNSTVCFPTEKFLYAIANRRLWIAVAPPNYHKSIVQDFGFKLHSCFDYWFDAIWDPAYKLQTLLQMLEPFAQMNASQWQQIYEDQQAVIEYNYQHLTSYGFFDRLAHLDQVENNITMPNLSSSAQVWHNRLQQKKSSLSNSTK